MITRGIRGAITVEENTSEAIGAATIKLLQAIVEKNNIEIDSISHVIFTVTKDLNADFPAKYARVNLKWKERSNNELLLYYGFVEEDNPYNSTFFVEITVSCILA